MNSLMGSLVPSCLSPRPPHAARRALAGAPVIASRNKRLSAASEHITICTMRIVTFMVPTTTCGADDYL